MGGPPQVDTDGGVINPDPPEDEAPGAEELPEQELEGKESVSGWMVGLSLLVGTVGIAAGIGFALPWLVAIGGAIVVATVLAYAAGKLADYAIGRPFRGAGSALAHVYNAGREALRGDFRKAGAELASIEAMDLFWLIILLLVIAWLLKWATQTSKKRRRR
jgi:hypothetical protein